MIHLKSAWVFLLTGTLLNLAAAEAEPPQKLPELLIRDVTVISPERAEPLPHTDVLIDEGRIVAIRPHAPATSARQILDGAGRFLIPGLIDSHVHLYHATGLKRRYTDDFDSLYAQFQQQQPRSYLYFGYTTLIELNADAEANRRFESTPLHPDLIHCGQGLVLSNDFMSTDFDTQAEFFAAYPNFLHDRFETPELPAGINPADHTPEATVARIADQGGRCVKLYFEEALWWPGAERPAFKLPSPAIAREVVAAAHRRGMSVLLHGTTPAAHRFALDTGIDVLAHGLWDWEGAAQGGTVIPTDVLDTVDALAASKVRWQPTVRTTASTASLFDTALLDDPTWAKVVPGPYLSYLRGTQSRARVDFERLNQGRMAAMSAPDGGPGLPLAQIVADYQDRYRMILARFQHEGGRLLLGTDTAVGGFGWGNPPGLNGYWEMRDWQGAGVPLDAILQAATLDNARAFHLDRDIGSVEVGKRAQLLLLSGNPLETLEAYDHIEQIILDGRVIERATLAADRPSVPAVGTRSLQFQGDARSGAFAGRLWYPSLPGPLQTFGASRIRDGYPAVADGMPALNGKAPLIILNHGSGGSGEALAWIATELARRGAWVVAADHPASSGGDPERASILEVWQQPLDVRLIIDQLLASELAARIDPQRIAVIGFSLGGATALSVAGVRFAFERFPAFCETHDDGACRAFKRHFGKIDAEFLRQANADLSDPRVRAAVAIAPGFTEASTQDSLRALRTPLLLITGEHDQQLPPRAHLDPIRAWLGPSIRQVEISRAQHFSFLPLCSADALQVLAESGERFVCEEVGDKTREQIHAETLSAIVGFLAEHGVWQTGVLP
ncbi:MAG: amidohydrolase family protein [Lysobacterales bacterium]